TARAVSEQTEVASALAAAAVRHTAAIQSVARATAEQTVAAKQLSQAVQETRAGARDIASGIAQQVKGAAAVAGDVVRIAAQIGKVRAANLEHAEALASIGATLAEAKGMNNGQRLPTEPA
ncbi:MAG: hypothetical protein ACJ78X_05865, partial [Myxococcales bacterium]